MRISRVILALVLFWYAFSCSDGTQPNSQEQHADIPADADKIPYSSVWINVSLSGKAPVVEGGYFSGMIYIPGIRTESGSFWSDGSSAEMTLEVSPDALESLVKTLIIEFNAVSPVYTYSEWRDGANRNPDLGIYTSEYLALLENSPGVRIRCSGVKDDYNRSMWLVVPMLDVNATFWDRLDRVLPQDERFQALVAGLRTFWKNNT